MLRLGILRSPHGHSLSEVMQNAALQYLNINGEYKAYGVSEDELKNVFEKLKADGIKGLNVTIPHKIKVIKFLDELTDTAKLIGAVNTITFNNGKSIGDNTDVIGFWESIPEKIRKRNSNKTVAILGCGGAAHAVCTALILNNAKSIKIYGRDRNKLESFKKHFLKTPRWGDSDVEIGLFDDIDLSDTSFLVNTTPIGMYPNINDMPIKKEQLKKLLVETSRRGVSTFVYDIIYNPPETKLLQDAKSLGLQTLNGVEMLVRQGAASLNIWLEKEIAPVSVMRMAVLRSLGHDTIPLK